MIKIYDMIDLCFDFLLLFTRCQIWMGDINFFNVTGFLDVGSDNDTFVLVDESLCVFQSGVTIFIDFTTLSLLDSTLAFLEEHVH